MTDDIVARLREIPTYADFNRPQIIEHEAADEIERLRAALLDIFDHELRASNRSFIACAAREALWPNAALGENSDD